MVYSGRGVETVLVDTVSHNKLGTVTVLGRRHQERADRVSLVVQHRYSVDLLYWCKKEQMYVDRPSFGVGGHEEKDPSNR